MTSAIAAKTACRIFSLLDIVLFIVFIAVIAVGVEQIVKVIQFSIFYVASGASGKYVAGFHLDDLCVGCGVLYFVVHNNCVAIAKLRISEDLFMQHYEC